MALSDIESNRIFDRIASRYDLVNGILSFGMHSSWREALARAFPPDTRRVLDLACGTASIPLAFLKCRPEITDITGVDLSGNMLAVARARLARVTGGDSVRLVRGNALAPDVAPGSFDAVTTGFALRNVADMMGLLVSAYRALKPSGYFGVLEFSRPDNMAARLLYHFYLGVLIPCIGALFTGNRAAYHHLSQSILRFPDRARFTRILRQAGFRTVTVRPMAFGAVTLYMAQK